MEQRNGYRCVDCIWQDQCQFKQTKCTYFDCGRHNVSELMDYEIDEMIEVERYRFRRIYFSNIDDNGEYHED